MERLQEINLALAAIREKLGQKARLEARTDDLRQQQSSLTEQTSVLRAALREEEHDVEKLEGLSMAALFQAMLGKKEERLEAERREALAARLKYEAAARSLADVESRLAATLGELGNLSSDEAHYESLLREKSGLLGDGAAVAEMRALEEVIARARGVVKEADEAVSAGQRVLRALESAQSELDSAEGWGVYDMLGGGIFATAIKHSHMDDARDNVYEAQMLMSRFRTELADVKVSMDIEIGGGDFLDFADYFFDGIIADWMAQSRIEEAGQSVGASAGQVEHVLNKLSTLRWDAEREAREAEEKLRRLLEQA